MKIVTLTDMDLNRLLRNELRTLTEYMKTFDSMTAEEKYGLREWMAQGKSVNCNPYYLYNEKGDPMDLLDASRTAEEMAADPERFVYSDSAGTDASEFDDEPF